MVMPDQKRNVHVEVMESLSLQVMVKNIINLLVELLVTVKQKTNTNIKLNTSFYTRCCSLYIVPHSTV